ncbi:MAG: KAP family NTPase [Acidobacteriota bacterium]|nr:KAP family NTPase [Acidobacteriota bacterium]
MPAEIQHIDDELAAALSIENESSRVEKLLELAPSLPEPLLAQTVDAMPLIQNENIRALALAGLGPYLKKDQLDKALRLAMEIGLNVERNQVLGSLGQHLPESERTTLIRIIKDEPEPRARLRGWMGLAPYLPSDLKQEAISTALTLENETERAEALIALAPHLPDVWKIKALQSARNISDPVTKIQAISGLIPSLPKKERANALDEVLTLARELPSPYDRVVALLTLLPQLPPDLEDDLFNEAYDFARSIQEPQQRIEMLTRLAETLPPGERLHFLRAALNNVENIKDDKARGDALITLARSSPPALHKEILKVAQEIKDSKVKLSVIIQLQGIIEQETASPLTADPPVEPHATDFPMIQDFPGSTEEPPSDDLGVETPDIEGGFMEVNEPEPRLLETPPPEVRQVKSKSTKSRGPRNKPAKTKVPVIEGPLEPPSHEESVGVKAYLHSDKWTLDDQLNYSLYADAIAEFIRHEDTKPPLAIGVLAPWGQGKTTLMKLIQNQLETKAKGQESANPIGVTAPPITPRVNFEYLRNWLQDPTNYKLEVEKLNYPTVWFNAWKYQNSEQVWAGMAYSILSQLVGQIGSQFEREKFWLALQAERVDFNAIRRDIHRMVFERIAPSIAISLTVGVIGLLLLLVGFSAGNILLGGGGGVALLSGVLIPIVQWVRAKTKVDSKPLEGKFAQYVRQPTYEGKLGFFHEIETDVQRVFRLLVAKGKPVVVFIDDLDRCSPGTVAQVIEAMNLFLSADFPDCYFVVGMDAQVVAASMEVAYENLDKKLKSVTRSYGSLGWYFMDKFIQLQFNIPNMTPDQRSRYLTKLFGRELEKKEVLSAAVLDDVEKNLEENLQSDTLKPEELPQHAAGLAKLRLQRPQAWQRLAHTLIQTSAKQLSDDSPVLQKYLERYEPFLGVSPRGIKRFANLYRFYSLSQLSRQSQGLPACSPSALARWLVIMLRWPQVVRWIQWEGEAKLSVGTSALNKAEALEKQLLKTTTHGAWLKYLEKLDPNHAEWMSDKQFYEFLKTPARSDEKLSFAVQTGVW